jgi:microcystin degradation protein MlrC
MRIAVGGISNESCSFSPLPSGEDDFSWWYDQKLLSRYDFLADLQDVTTIPIVWARALPGGPVLPPVYERFKREFLSRLQDALPLDGIYLDMHGALFVQGLEDAEGDFTEAVRQQVGGNCVITASYDLHGNLSKRVFETVDVITAYRTAPHIDEAATRARAFQLLLRALRTNTRPQKHFISIPIILPGEKTATTWEPGKSLYRHLNNLIDNPVVWDASILVGYAWADEARTGASVVAFGEDGALVQRVAEEIAGNFWNVRHEFRFGAEALPIEQAVRAAIASNAKPVFISDSADNITGGGVGDVTTLLQVMLREGVRNSLYSSIVDSAAVEICWQLGIGGVATLSLGGKLDTIHGSPLKITGRIQLLHRFNENNRLVVLKLDGITLIVTERRTAFLDPKQFEAIGIHLVDYDIIVLKLGYLSPEFSELAAKEILALSSGVIDQALDTLTYKHIRRPIFPLDPQMSWHFGA